MQNTDHLYTIRELIDQHKMSIFQWRIILICFFIVLLDGFDIAIVAYIAPILKKEMILAPNHLPYLFTSGVLGLMLGSMLFGPLADIFGRKKVLVISTLLYGTSTILCGFVDTFPSLVGFRFFTGLGLGGAMPISIALCAEYSPQRYRMMLCTLSWSGFTLGIATGGIIANIILEQLTWHWLFYIGGILPLLTIILIIAALPESLEYLLKQTNEPNKQTLQRIIKNIVQEKIPSSLSLQHSDIEQSHRTVKLLLTKDNRKVTLLLWLSFFLSLGIFYLLTYWIPILFEGIYSFQKVNLLTTMLPIGGTIGAFLLAWWIDHYKKPFAILSFSYLLACVLLLCVVGIVENYAFLLLTILLIGFSIAGAQNSLNLVAATIYPAYIRTTGVSWAMANGRLGSIIGSYIGVWLAGDKQLDIFFNALSIGAFICGITLLSIHRTKHSH
ncbi:MFS transporter [Pelistega sp. NLN82]|uniref:MFS transporter n=1 Tax=Pelistega ratti TaxID=2652177 RepID=A0A6L9Y4C3_9BURK|nr:MFS transporter [Pelistega ratti]NEN75312.1 MFS transporter [Pelistega ratti]